MRFFIAVLAAIILSPATAVIAATPGEPAYRQVLFKANYPWSEGFTLSLEPDEMRCRAKYGKSWREKCSAALGRVGNTVKGIELRPAAKGYWQWNTATSMTFIPETPQSIKPDTAYTLDIGGLYCPAAIVLDKKSVSLRTLPLSARLLDINFWVDPSPAARHRLAASLEFNYPVPQSAPDIELRPAGGSRFGKAEKVWSPNRDRLNVSWLVKQLPDLQAQAAIELKGLGQIVLKDDSIQYWPPAKNGGVIFRKNIPARDAIFGIKKMELKPDVDANLNKGHMLTLETSLYVLPEHVLKNLLVLELPEFNSPEAKEPYNWKAAPAIPQSVLDKGRRLVIEPVDQDKSARSVFKFRVPVQDGRYLLAQVKSELESASKQKLRRAWMEIARAMPSDASLEFLQPGNILPLKNDGRLDLYATDLDSIKWEIQLVRDPFLALIAESSHEPFARPLNHIGLGMEAFSEIERGELPLARAGQGKAQFASLDLTKALEKLSRNRDHGGSPSGLARVSLVGMRDGKEKAWASRMVLPTDLGIMVKRGILGDLDCFTQCLNDGRPAANARVSILGANGKAVTNAETDDKGHVSFPSMMGLKMESAPVAAVAMLDGQLAWLPLGDRSRELNYSEFATGGAHSAPGGLNAYIFGQRGIYRPGDSLHFGCIVRLPDFSRAPADMPLYAELRDPRGMKIHGQSFRSGEFGIAELSWQIPETALSGRYILNILTGKNGDNIGTATARVEEFQPDTLKLKIYPQEIKGWLHMDNSVVKGQEVRMFLQNLYGSPAAGHTIRTRVDTCPAKFRFPGYEEYTFTDSSPFRGDGQKRNMPEAKTDARGEVVIKMPEDLLGASTTRVEVSAEGFELGGGRASGAQASFIVSPMSLILGHRPLGSLTNMRFIPQNTQAELEFLALDPQLNRSVWKGLEFSLARISYVTSLVSDGRGGYRYDETPAETHIKTWKADIPAEGARMALDTELAGEFLLTARDANGVIVARVPYAVAGERLDPPDAPLAGGKMRLRLDKDSYNAGDVINLSLGVPYDGAGLISIERDGVAAFSWFKAKAGESTHQIAIPNDFEGKGYVVVSFVRSTDSPAIYMAPHTYAVSPFSANISRRDMNLRVEAPQTILPGKNLETRLFAKEPGLAVLFVVDEGILQLSNYQNPSPLHGLLADRALDVRTLQAYDLLMPDHVKLAPRLSAFGGGVDGAPFGKRFQNPFKRKNEPPVASWSALVPVGTEPITLSVPIPDYYNGQLRIMAVGAGAESAGAAIARSNVVSPLVLSPNIPLTISPGDIFEGSLTLANTSDKPANVNLRMEAGNSLEIVESPQPDLDIAPGGEALASFRMKVLDDPGAVEIAFTAKVDGNVYRRSGSLSVRPASPLRTSLQGGIAQKSQDLPVKRQVYAQYAQSVATISALPISLAAGFAQYLQTYPYGCTEQILSRSFAQTLLRAWPVFPGDGKARKKLLDATLSALNSRFTGQGISLWPNAEADPLVTVYAADFLLALREAGIGGGDDLLDQICEAIEANCALNDSSLAAARTSAYAIWILTRDGRITTQLIENLQDALRERNVAGWRNDITAALIAASQKEMHMRDVNFPEKLAYGGDGLFDEFAQYALHMTLMARYAPEKINESIRKGFYETAGTAMLENSFATFSANQGIRSLLALAGNVVPDILLARLRCLDNPAEGSGDILANGALFRHSTSQCGTYALDMPAGSQEVFWQIATTGYDKTVVENRGAHAIEISREYVGADGQPVKSIMQGDVIHVRITARAMTEQINDCVISDLLPGGFEMVIRREDSNQELPQGIKFLDRRDDRMLLFADLTNNPLVFTYPLRAVNAGLFTVPPIVVEAMYNQAQYGHGKAEKIEIRN